LAPEQNKVTAFSPTKEIFSFGDQPMESRLKQPTLGDLQVHQNRTGLSIVQHSKASRSTGIDGALDR